jgi:hypothetical protein
LLDFFLKKKKGVCDKIIRFGKQIHPKSFKTLARTLRENNKIGAPGARYPNST